MLGLSCGAGRHSTLRPVSMLSTRIGHILDGLYRWAGPAIAYSFLPSLTEEFVKEFYSSGGDRDTDLDILLHSYLPTLLGSASACDDTAVRSGSTFQRPPLSLPAPASLGPASVALFPFSFISLPLYHFPLECISVSHVHAIPLSARGRHLSFVSWHLPYCLQGQLSLVYFRRSRGYLPDWQKCH